MLKDDDPAIRSRAVSAIIDARERFNKSKRKTVRKFVKPKVRLLSEQEYLDQSRVETEKALRELRDYCQVWSLKQFFPLPIFG